MTRLEFLEKVDGLILTVEDFIPEQVMSEEEISELWEYVKRELLDYTVVSSLSNTQMLMNPKARIEGAVHLPPKYLKDFKKMLLFVPMQEEISNESEKK